MNVTQSVNSHLQNMVDAQEQYSRRSCLVIDGMAKPGHEEGTDDSDDVKKVIKTLERECGINQDVIKNNLDKTHPIGQSDEYGKQLRIVKFTMDSLQWIVLRRWCLENTSIGEMHILKDKNVVVSLYKLM